MTAPGPAQAALPELFPARPPPTQVRQPFALGYARSNFWFYRYRSACRAAPGCRAGHGGAGVGGRRAGAAGHGLSAGADQNIRRIRLHGADHGGAARRIDADRGMRGDLEGAVTGAGRRRSDPTGPSAWEFLPRGPSAPGAPPPVSEPHPPTSAT